MSIIIKKYHIGIVLLLSALLTAAVVLLPGLVTAQEPEGGQAGQPTPELNQEATSPFEAYRLFFREQRIAPFDLQVVKRATMSTINSGSLVTFIITITNRSTVNPAIGITFYDNYPPEMSQVNYKFSVTNVISDNLSKPTWLFLSPISPNGRIVVTVTGRLNSVPSINVTNQAIVSTFTVGADPNPNNNESSVQINLIGSDPDATIMYLPLFFKNPQPTIILAYHEDFEDEDAWLEFDSGGCKTENRDDRYWVTVDSGDITCLPPARNESNPEEPFRTYGEFQVTAYHSDGQSNASYGIFINGEGDDNYYYFRIFPNDDCSDGGRWQLRRRADNDETTLLNGSCSSAIREGIGPGATNVLKITHTNDHRLTLYVNGVLLSSIVDTSSDHLTGEATGLYIQSDDEDVIIKFDDFKVYRYLNQ